MIELSMPTYDPTFGGLVTRPVTVRYVHVIDKKSYPFSMNVRFTMAYFIFEGRVYASWSFCNPKDQFIKEKGRDNATMHLYEALMNDLTAKYIVLEVKDIVEQESMTYWFKPELIEKLTIGDFKHQALSEGLKRKLFSGIEKHEITVPSWFKY